MAGFPSSSGTKASLDKAWNRATDESALIKSTAQGIRTKASTQNVGGFEILSMLVTFAQSKDALNVCAAVPGIGAYAQTQVNDGTFNISSAFAAMITALDNIAAWGYNTFPKAGGTSYLAFATIGADGRWIDRQFTPAEIAASGLNAQLDALIATID